MKSTKLFRNVRLKGQKELVSILVEDGIIKKNDIWQRLIWENLEGRCQRRRSRWNQSRIKWIQTTKQMSPESQTLQWPRTRYRRYRISKETIKRIWHWTELNNTQNPRGWSPAKMQHISPHQPRDFSLNHIGKILSFFNCFFQKKSVPLVTSTGRKSNHISYMNSLIVEKYYIYTKHEIWRIYLWTVFY